MRRLTPGEQEAIRERVVRAVLQNGLTQTAAAALFGVSRASVNTWVGKVAEKGADALKSGRRGAKPGDRASLAPLQCARIVTIIRGNCPNQLKFPFALWTREAVQALIADEFKINLAITTVGNYLRRWGFTPQKPAVRAYERNPEAVRRWLEEQYPAIVARAKREGALIWWGDEMGLRSRHVAGRSYSPKGETPVVTATGKYFGCNMISAITNRGELAFMLFEGKFNASVFLEFSERLLQQTPQKVFLILDNLKVHNAKVAAPWFEENKERIERFFLPSYSPDLNPDEILNQDLKTNAIGKKRARNLDELVANTRSHLLARQARPETVAAYFGEKQVRYAAAA
jgi:transposase